MPNYINEKENRDRWSSAPYLIFQSDFLPTWFIPNQGNHQPEIKHQQWKWSPLFPLQHNVSNYRGMIRSWWLSIAVISMAELMKWASLENAKIPKLNCLQSLSERLQAHLTRRQSPGRCGTQVRVRLNPTEQALSTKLAVTNAIIRRIGQGEADQMYTVLPPEWKWFLQCSFWANNYKHLQYIFKCSTSFQCVREDMAHLQRHGSWWQQWLPQQLLVMWTPQGRRQSWHRMMMVALMVMWRSTVLSPQYALLVVQETCSTRICAPMHTRTHMYTWQWYT